MKIRTRLLLFLLPTNICSVVLFWILLTYQELLPSPLLILAVFALIVLVTISALFFIANKISHPIQKLNNSALAIAAGQYGESIQPSGPREIVELASTLNTMSECLHENINRLRDNSLLRERMYGEYECAMLLQHLMLQKNIDTCRSDVVAIRAITLFSDNPRGLLLNFPPPSRPDLFHIHLAEAAEEGFEGMYQLLTEYRYSKESQTHTALLLDRATATLQAKGPSIPFVWSFNQQKFLELPCTVEPGDFFFLGGGGIARFYKDPQRIGEILGKVLKVFAQDGLDTTVAMLNKEISFAAKKKKAEEDLHLLCFQILTI